MKRPFEKKVNNRRFQETDFGKSVTNFFASAGTSIVEFSIMFYINARAYITQNWIKLIVLIASSTQTFALLSYVAPPWAWWLPYIGILLIEGSIPFWQVKEYNADMADGNLEDTEKNAQEKLANKMVWSGLVVMAVTMIAGLFIEVSDSEKLSAILKPDERTTAFISWVSMIGIFLFGAVQVYADWQYKRKDPFLLLEKEKRAGQRALTRKQIRTINKGEEEIQKHQTRATIRSYREAGKRIGTARAEKHMKTVELQGNPADGNNQRKTKNDRDRK